MKDYVVLNFKQTQSKLKADDIDNTIPSNQLAELLNGDSNPYYSVEAIEYPAMGNTHIWGMPGKYTEKYFNGLEKNLKANVIPGSKNGHSYGGKPTNDIFLVGMKVVSNGDGTGTAYFKNYIPPKDFNGGENSGLIRDAKLGLLQFSLISTPVYDEKELAKSGQYLVIGTKGGDRNDAVEEGAMKQTVNSKDGINFDLMTALVKNGQYSRKNIDGEIIQNGRVSYPVLRSMIARADCENKTEIGNILSMIDKSTNGRKLMDAELQEAVERVQNAAKNGSIVISDVFKNAGIALRTEDDKKNEETVKTLNAKNLGADPFAAIDTLIAQNKANADAIVKNEVTTAFGAEKVKNSKGEEVENPAYTYAFEKCSGKSGDALKNELEAVKNSAVMKGIRANQADPFSKINMIENGGAKPTGKVANEATVY